MKFTRSLLALSLLSFSTEAFATAFTWTDGAMSGDWNTPANWDIGISYPNLNTDSADMPSTHTGMVSVTNFVTINSITFDAASSGVGYTISNGTYTITFAGTNPFITLTEGTHTFDIGLDFAANTYINLNSTDASSLIFSGPFTQSGGARTITFVGPGAATYNYVGLSQPRGPIVLTGGAQLTIAGTTGISATLEADSFTITNGTITLGTIGSGASDRGILQSDSPTGNISIGANGKITSLYDGIIYLPNGGSGALTIANGGRLEMGQGSGHTGIISSLNGSDAITVTNSGSVAPVSGTATTPSSLSIFPGAISTYHQTGTGVLDVYLDMTSSDKLSSITTHNFTLDSGSTLNVHVVDATGVGDLGHSLPVLLANNGSGTLTGTFTNINLIGSLPAGITMDPQYNVDAYQLFGLLFSGSSPSPTPSPSINTSISSYVGGSNQAVFTSVNNSNIRLGRQMQRVRGNFTENLSRSSPNANPVAVSATTFNTDGLLVDSNEKINLQEQDSSTKNPKTPANFYTGAIGNTGDVNKKSGQAGFDYWSAGALAGFDYAFSQVGVGILTSYERTDAHVDGSWGKFTIDQLHASLYATYAPKELPAISLNVIGGGGYEIYDIHRNTPGSTAKGYPKGYEVDGLLEIDYTFSARDYTWMPERLYFGPMVSAQYVYLEKGKYTERGAGSYDLTVSRQTTDSLRSFLGANLNYTIIHKNVEFTPEIYAGWQREFRNKNKSQSFAPILVGGAASSVLVVGAGRNTALAGVDLAVTFFKKYQIEASYDFEWNDLFQDNSVYLGFNLKF